MTFYDTVYAEKNRRRPILACARTVLCQHGPITIHDNHCFQTDRFGQWFRVSGSGLACQITALHDQPKSYAVKHRHDPHTLDISILGWVHGFSFT